jgi:hypothetical protein
LYFLDPAPGGPTGAADRERSCEQRQAEDDQGTRAIAVQIVIGQR